VIAAKVAGFRGKRRSKLKKPDIPTAPVVE